VKLVLMGVAGCGKSSVGAALSPVLGLRYLDGDDLHPASSIAKMARGEPLTDADRAPWLTEVGGRLRAADLIIGCSALRRRYRDLIRTAAGAAVGFIHLAGSRGMIEARIGARQGHFMPPSLIDSQFAALEPPEPDEWAVRIDIDQPLTAIVAQISAAMRGRFVRPAR